MSTYMIGCRDFRPQDLDVIDCWLSRAETLTTDQRDTLLDLVSEHRERLRREAEASYDELKQTIAELREELEQATDERDTLLKREEELAEMLTPFLGLLGRVAFPRAEAETLCAQSAELEYVKPEAQRVPGLEDRVRELEAQNLELLLS